MQTWAEFYFLCGSSAGGLTGLMFIAVTFGQKLVRKDNLEQIDIFVSTVCFHFIQVFILSCIASVPTITDNLMGVATFLAGFIRATRIPKAYKILRRSQKQPDNEVEKSDWVFTFAMPAILHFGFIATGILFFKHDAVAVNLFAICLIALLGVPVRSAWDMIIFFATKNQS